MEDYRLQSHLDGIHSVYPVAEARPLIGITSNYAEGLSTLGEGYYKQVVEAGGVPVIIPPCGDKNVLVNTLDGIDGLVLSGGGDYNPLWAGEEPSPRLRGINAERDLPEMLLTRLAYHRNMPVLGICRGIQTIAMSLCGRVEQDIGTGGKPSGAGTPPVKHSQEAPRPEATHSVYLCDGTVLRQLYGAERIYVNSFHHQAIADPGNLFRIAAMASDGVVEAVESLCHKPVIGVQWHPECLADGLPLFRWIVDEASVFRRAKRLHAAMLTIDSHCDTPMFFAQGIDFGRRDSRILVDIHKMTEGRLDAVTMAAYVPQPKPGEEFSSIVPLKASGPKAYADLIFDKVEDIARGCGGTVSIARNARDLLVNKRLGKKSLMLGIENGLALEHDVANVEHFAERGVTYITLCHNGDNDICGSARGCSANGGVSDFGVKVIREMNRLGVMVDMSHASEKSFYDALDISASPIVCSHSNCKALCGSPRNLSDGQLRAIAIDGGVAQITLYKGFLRDDGAEASILDAISHLEHAVKVMGIDYVGIGTDFDGDGGVPGFADASEALNFTMHLLRRRYSEEDIAKIWGGNWLRVMNTVQLMGQGRNTVSGHWYDPTDLWL